MNNCAMGLLKEEVTETQHFSRAAGFHEDESGMGGDSHHAAQNLRCHSIQSPAVHDALEPCSAEAMVGTIGPEGMNKNVDVG